MGVLYDHFKQRVAQARKDWFTDKIGLVKFEENHKKYEIYFTRKRANKYSFIYCKNNAVEWEQFPILPRIVGRYYGDREQLVTLAPSKNCIKIFVVMGRPNSFVGLDEGNFRSIHRFDEAYINVMSEARFKEI